MVLCNFERAIWVALAAPCQGTGICRFFHPILFWSVILYNSSRKLRKIMKYFAHDKTITTVAQIHSPASNMYYFQIGGCLFHFYRALDTNIISKHLASLRNKNRRFNFALKLLKVQSIPTSVRVPHLSGHWIRIRMELHSFSLLDPDLHSIYGSASRRINSPNQSTPNARQWLITASFVSISVLRVS